MQINSTRTPVVYNGWPATDRHLACDIWVKRQKIQHTLYSRLTLASGAITLIWLAVAFKTMFSGPWLKKVVHHHSTTIFCAIQVNKQGTQQWWQTSAIAMHLVVARLLSMSIIICLLPTSNMCCDFKQQQWFKYSLYIFILCTSVNDKC